MTSAYPLAHDVLVARVRQLADELGHTPSQRRVMQEFGVGRDRAKTAIIDATTTAPQTSPLTDAPSRTADQAADQAAGAPTERTLHVVPDPADEPARERSAPAEPAVETRSDAPEVQGTPAEPAAVPARRRQVPRWPLLIIALGAFVSIWGGWVGLGKLSGFGEVVLLPGILDGWTVDSSITLPLGVEAYAAFAMTAWLSDRPVSERARRFARWSSIAALALGVFGQATYHLLVTSGATRAPDAVVVFVSCLPVVVLGAGAALAHLLMSTDEVNR